jgi:predicted ArsR family transcriptional regulator
LRKEVDVSEDESSAIPPPFPQDDSADEFQDAPEDEAPEESSEDESQEDSTEPASGRCKWNPKKDALLLLLEKARFKGKEIASHLGISPRAYYDHSSRLKKEKTNRNLDMKAAAQEFSRWKKERQKKLFVRLKRALIPNAQLQKLLSRVAPKRQTELLALLEDDSIRSAISGQHNWNSPENALLACLIHSRLEWVEIAPLLEVSPNACQKHFSQLSEEDQQTNWGEAAPAFAKLSSERQGSLLVRVRRAMQRLVQLGRAVPQDENWEELLLSALSRKQRANLFATSPKDDSIRPTISGYCNWTPAKRALLFCLNDAGLALDEIAMHFGVSQMACRDCFLQGSKKDREPNWNAAAPAFNALLHEQQGPLLVRLRHAPISDVQLQKLLSQVAPKRQTELLTLLENDSIRPTISGYCDWTPAKRALLICLRHSGLIWAKIAPLFGVSAEACQQHFSRLLEEDRQPNWEAAAPAFAALSHGQQESLIVQLRYAMPRLVRLGRAGPQDENWEEDLLSALSDDQRANLLTSLPEDVSAEPASRPRNWNSLEDALLACLRHAKLSFVEIGTYSGISPIARPNHFSRLSEENRQPNWEAAAPAFAELSSERQGSLFVRVKRAMPQDENWEEDLLSSLSDDQRANLLVSLPEDVSADPATRKQHNWNSSEDALLTCLRHAGLIWDKIAPCFGVSANACQKHFSQLSEEDQQPNWGEAAPAFAALSSERQGRLLVRVRRAMQRLVQLRHAMPLDENWEENLLSALSDDQRAILRAEASRLLAQHSAAPYAQTAQGALPDRRIIPQAELPNFGLPLPEPLLAAEHEWTDAKNALLFHLRRLGFEWDQIASIFKIPNTVVCMRQFLKLRKDGFDPQPDWPGILEIITPLFPTMGHNQQTTILEQLPEDQREPALALLPADLQTALRADLE